MEEAGLRITLTAEVDQAIRSLNNVNDQFDRLGGEAVRALHEAEGALRDLSSGTVSINRLSQALIVFRQASQAATDSSSLQQYNRNIQVLETQIGNLSRAGRTLNSAVGGGSGGAGYALQNLGRIASDAPFGFIAIQNNLDPLIQSFGQLTTQSGGVGGALKALGSSLMGPAGIALAFTVVSAGATALIQKYGSLSAGIAALNPFVDEATKTQLALNKAQLDGSKAAQTEIAHLDVLYKASQDLLIPLQDRKAIVNELQKQYPETFNNYTREAILAGRAAAAVDGLKSSLVALSVSKATEKLAAEQGEQLVALKLEAQSTEEAIKRIAAGSGTGIIATALGFTDAAAKAKALTQFQAIISQNKEKQLEVENKIGDIQKTQLDLAEKFGAKALGVKGVATTTGVLTQLTAALAEVDSKVKLTGETAKEIAKDKLPLLNKAFDAIAAAGDGDAKAALSSLGAQIKSLGAIAATKSLPTVTEILAKLGRSLSAVDAQSKVLGGSMGGIATEKVKLLQSAFEDLVKSGLTPASPQLQKIAKQITDITDMNIAPLKSALPHALDDGVKELKDKIFSAQTDYSKLLNGFDLTGSGKFSKITLAPTVDVTPLNKNLNTSFADAQTQFKVKVANFQSFLASQLNPFTKQVNALIQESTQNGIASLADSVGAALVSGNISSVLSSFVDTISGFLTSMGKLLIIQGGAIEAFKASLASFQGIGAIAAGAALIAASAAFKALAGKGVHSYATGGIVTSPQLALIGDNPGRKEAVVPSEMFDKIGGGVGDMVLTTKIKGNDLYVLVQRAGREFNRFN